MNICKLMVTSWSTNFSLEIELARRSHQLPILGSNQSKYGVLVMSMYQFLALLLFLTSIVTSWIELRVLAINILIGSPSDGNNTMNLTAGQYLNASHFYLVMQPDCNLITYNGSTPFLTTKLAPVPRGSSCYAALQANGNFVINHAASEVSIWSSETPAWNLNSSTRFTTFRYMILGRDGNLNMYGPDNRLLTDVPLFVPVNKNEVTYSFPSPDLEWRPTMPLAGYPYMPAEYFLTQGSRLQTVDRRFVLRLGAECKLQSQEIWNANDTLKRVVWEPSDQRRVIDGNCELRLRQDGLLEIRDSASGAVYWSSSARGDASVNWVLKLNADDGHVSVSDILNLGNILWTSAGAPRDPGSVWPLMLGLFGGSLVAAMAASAFWIFYVRPRFRDTAERDFQRRLKSIGCKTSQVLSEAVIKQATNNFGCRIGHGGFGDVFYGRLAGGQEIAAKVLTARSHQSKEEFFNEIELLSVVHHKHLVSLLGYCSTRKHQVLVYEYMGGGDLRHRLQGYGAARNPLSWRQRISIILQVAEGLEYLHDKCTPAIIHRDVKSNNILLTTNLSVAKVADFGLSKLRRKDQEIATHITTVVKGTPGYLDPEYHETGLLTEKSDVYAFGIVLMEILTGQHHMSISEGVSEARRLELYEGLADPNLKGDFDRDRFVRLVYLSLWCTSKSNLRRPHMREVVQQLRESGTDQPHPVHRESVDSSGESPCHKDLEHSMEADSHYDSSFSGLLESSSSMN